jgi:hypothetical protein
MVLKANSVRAEQVKAYQQPHEFNYRSSGDGADFTVQSVCK